MRRRNAVSCLLALAMTLAASAVARAQATPARADSARETWSNDALRRELLAMVRADQEAREGIGAAMQARDTAFLRRMMRTDSANALRLRAILREHGWPGRSVVGKEGSEAAWLVAQHGPDDLQKEALGRMQAAAPGEVDPDDLALLTDRVRIDEGKPQLYGSQFTMKDGKLVAEPIEDPDRVDERRAAVGLPPLAEYVEMLEKVYGILVDRSSLPTKPAPPRRP